MHKLFWLRVVADLPTPFELALLSAICRNDATMKPLWFTNMRFICKCRATMQKIFSSHCSRSYSYSYRSYLFHPGLALSEPPENLPLVLRGPVAALLSVDVVVLEAVCGQ